MPGLSSLKLTSETEFDKDEIRKVKIILKFLLEHNESEDFRQPVDWKGTNDFIQVWTSPIIRLSSNTPWICPPLTRNSKMESISMLRISLTMFSSSGTIVSSSICPHLYNLIIS